MMLLDKEFYSMQDIAELFGCSLSHVKQHLRWALPAPVRIGKRGLRWHKNSIHDYVKNHSDK